MLLVWQNGPLRIHKVDSKETTVVVETKIIIDCILTTHEYELGFIHRHWEKKSLTKRVCHPPLVSDYPQQWNKSHLPVTYPFTRSACKVDAFLFFQSECRLSHFWCCISSFSITISVLDGPLKQMKDIHRPSHVSMLQLWRWRGPNASCLFQRYIAEYYIKATCGRIIVKGMKSRQEAGPANILLSLMLCFLTRTRIGIRNSKRLLVAFTVVHTLTYCFYSSLPPKIQKADLHM